MNVPESEGFEEMSKEFQARDAFIGLTFFLLGGCAGEIDYKEYKHDHLKKEVEVTYGEPEKKDSKLHKPNQE
jgi:hypothetical protein